ncbi:hypothetical protein [Seonamhaeicola sp. ML3]|uniref:hypothetical protein n=1 Tax=Seonamhaeicola sp. ML3 TaxID=2937786 RepID=UPI00200E4D0D|nr:hypothetical protein [Seonamhaeicola sp. ML3]
MKDLIPLKVNNEWTYKQFIYDKTKSKTTEKIVINKVSDLKKHDGQTWYLLKEFGDEFYVQNTDEGQISAEFDKNTLIQTSLFLKNPDSIEFTPFEYTEVTKQNDLEGNSNIPDIDTNKITLVSKDVPIIIENQKYNCHEYEVNPILEADDEIESYKITMYIELGTGIVKHIIEDDYEIVTSELINKKL